MRKIVVAFGVLVVFGNSATAQSWAPWNQPYTYEQQKAHRAQEAAERARQQRGASAAFALFDGNIGRPRGPAFLDGGPRPSIAPSSPSVVQVSTGQPVGTIVIDQSARKLYLTQSATSALVYPISVGRDGFQWTGREKISRVADWPDWHPPAEMRQRQPELPEKMSGGLNNPLGAKALYLGNSLYRIHGSNTRTVGSASSSGCFRMMNSHVVDLASRVGVGTTVVVRARL